VVKCCLIGEVIKGLQHAGISESEEEEEEEEESAMI